MAHALLRAMSLLYLHCVRDSGIPLYYHQHTALYYAHIRNRFSSALTSLLYNTMLLAWHLYSVSFLYSSHLYTFHSLFL